VRLPTRQSMETDHRQRPLQRPRPGESWQKTSPEGFGLTVSEAIEKGRGRRRVRRIGGIQDQVYQRRDRPLDDPHDLAAYVAVRLTDAASLPGSRRGRAAGARGACTRALLASASAACVDYLHPSAHAMPRLFSEPPCVASPRPSSGARVPPNQSVAIAATSRARQAPRTLRPARHVSRARDRRRASSRPL